MPKTNLCKSREDPREAAVRAMIAGGCARVNINKSKLSEKTGNKKSTLCTHIRNPRDMRLGELWDIIDFLKPEESEKQKIV